MMPVTITIEALSAGHARAELAALLEKPVSDFPPEMLSKLTDEAIANAGTVPEVSKTAELAKTEETPTAEIVPIAERKKPGRPKKSETVVEATPAAPATATVEEARAVLSDIKSKIGMEEARQLNKKHGDQPLNDKTPEQWAAIVAEGKTILKALED